jgi:hypothetical protein
LRSTDALRERSVAGNPCSGEDIFTRTMLAQGVGQNGPTQKMCFAEFWLRSRTEILAPSNFVLVQQPQLGAMGCNEMQQTQFFAVELRCGCTRKLAGDKKLAQIYADLRRLAQIKAGTPVSRLPSGRPWPCKVCLSSIMDRLCLLAVFGSALRGWWSVRSLVP